MAWQEGIRKINAQNPLPTDGDSVYAKDIDIENSSIGDFEGEITDLFDDYNSNIVAASVGGGGANPKTFTIRLNRPLVTSIIGFGSPDTSLSNGKVEMKGLDGTILRTVDQSSDDTKRGVMFFTFEQTAFIEVFVSFYTDDAVTIGGSYIPKSNYVTIGAIDGLIPIETSTADTLLADGVYTSGIIDTKNYGIIVVSCYSDVASATDGLSIQFSTDKLNWYWTDEYTIAATSGKTFSVQPQARYMRVVYTNGAVEQTIFVLQSQLKPVYIKPSSHRITDPITGQDDAELVKAVLTGENPGGTFVNGQFTTIGNFKMSLEEYDPAFTSDPLPVRDPLLHAARGLVTGIKHVNKYGRALDGVQTTATDIWDRADIAATQQIWLAPTAARIHTIVSTNTADDGTPEGAGAGAQAVRIWYLADWDTAEAYEDVILNGVAGVAMNNAAVIIHRMKVIPVGTTYAINSGIISATAAAPDSTVTASISAGQGQTNMAIYGIPSTQTAYMTHFELNSHNRANPGTVTEVDFTMLINERPDLNTTAFINKSNKGTSTAGGVEITKDYKPYKAIPGPAIIKFQGTASASDIEGTAEFDLYLVTN
jgi:hypothetical protein